MCHNSFIFIAIKRIKFNQSNYLKIDREIIILISNTDRWREKAGSYFILAFKDFSFSLANSFLRSYLSLQARKNLAVSSSITQPSGTSGNSYVGGESSSLLSSILSVSIMSFSLTLHYKKKTHLWHFGPNEYFSVIMMTLLCRLLWQNPVSS